MRQGFFITGTDTGVGKSEVAAALSAHYVEMGFEVHPRKPVESGCLPNHKGETLFPQDGYILKVASQTSDSLAEITPYRFPQPISPERAARLCGNPLSLEQLLNSCQSTLPQQRDSELVVVEGAGGFYSPLAEQCLNADLATALQLPIILVTEDRLGVVNQVLLARQAIVDRGLDLYAIILNKHKDSDNGNLEEITRWVTEPVIPLPIMTHTTRPWRAMVQPLAEQFTVISGR